MKTNIKLFFLVIILSAILIYPIGYLANSLFVHDSGTTSFDIGLDSSAVNILNGFMFVPPLLASLILGLYGKDNWKWLFAAVISLPSVAFMSLLGSYVFIPVAAFVVGLILALVTNLIKNKNQQNVRI